MAARLLEQGVNIGVPLVRDGLILWLLTRTRRGIRNRHADLRARHFAQARKLRPWLSTRRGRNLAAWHFSARDSPPSKLDEGRAKHGLRVKAPHLVRASPVRQVPKLATSSSQSAV